MTLFEEAMAAPRIEVIDAAIARIENGQAPLRSPRIAALKNFRQLCLDAAK